MISKKCIKEIRKVFENYYYKNPEFLSETIKKILTKYDIKFDEILITGETKNLTLYIFTRNYVAVYMPFSELSVNPILQKIHLKRILNKSLGIFSRTKELDGLLKLPKLVLINPYIIEKYPVPRLSLNVSILASYIRKHQKAHVWILDTQLGLKIKDIKKEILRIKPDIIGVSIPHGQTPLAIKILDKIYQLKASKKLNSLIVIGNFIAASFPKYFLERYPGIIIAKGEGENTIIDLIDYIKGRKKLEEVSGIIAKSRGKTIITPIKSVNMDELPPPAFDTVEKLAELKGALTHEWNRGCSWGRCTFCPRHHKPKYFKGMSPKTIISQLKYFNDIMDKFPKLSRHLYIADEETIGGIDESETNRLIKIAKGIIKNKIRISFDAYSRIDQIYNPKLSKKWHVDRMKMWYYLKKAGLARVFVGVESASKTQLLRYGKGITPEQSIMAIRLLNLLGIECRIGFVMFDPLMNLNELIENILFLERKDVLMKPVKIDKYNFEELFELLHQRKFIEKMKLGEPLYTRVSYMLAQLEVLVNSSYIKLLKLAERKYNKKLIIGKPDLKIGKIKVRYLDPKIGLLTKFSQEWIDRNFEVMYAIKGLRKTAEYYQKLRLFEMMKTHRKLSLDFIKSMVLILIRDRKHPWKPPKILERHGYLGEFLSLLDKDRKYLEKSFQKCLRIFLQIMEKEIINPTLKLLKQKEIEDTEDNRLMKAILRWKNYNSKSRIIAE